MPPRSSLAPKDPEERRRRILAAAVDVLTEKGFAGTRIADVAAAAGTSPALVVYHFGTLDDLLAACYAYLVFAIAVIAVHRLSMPS